MVFKQCVLQLVSAKDGNKEQKPVDSISLNLSECLHSCSKAWFSLVCTCAGIGSSLLHLHM